jgi:hypothetical protein
VLILCHCRGVKNALLPRWFVGGFSCCKDTAFIQIGKIFFKECAYLWLKMYYFV